VPTDLRALLDDLTDDVGGMVPPRDLWTRGRTFRRRRLAGYAVIAVIAGLLGSLLVGVSWTSHRQLSPADRPKGGVGVPDRVYQLGGWQGSLAPGTPLLAVASTERPGWWGTSGAIAGLSAETGQYGYLALPDFFDEQVALAPDGRRVAYWTKGPRVGDDTDTISGVAVYDALSGAVDRVRLTSRKGAVPGILGWTDEDTLVISHGGLVTVDDPRIGELVRGATPLVWHVTEGDPRPSPWLAPGSVEGVEGGRVLVEEGVLVDLESGQRVEGELYGNGSGIGPWQNHLAVRGDRFAVPGGGDLPSRSPNKVVVGRLTVEGQPSQVRVVPHSARTFQVVSWLDDRTIAVVRRTFTRIDITTQLEAIDLRTGQSRLMAELGGLEGTGWVWADDLLTAPSVPGVEPPTPMDPRAALVLWLLLAAGTVVLVVAWRRRVRP